MHFSKTLKVKIDDDKKKATLSIRVTDDHVVVYRFDLQDFKVMASEFMSLLKDVE